MMCASNEIPASPGFASRRSPRPCHPRGQRVRRRPPFRRGRRQACSEASATGAPACFIWALMAALVVGLAGFGIGAGGGITSQNVARVGDEPGHRRRLRPRHAAGAPRPTASRSAATLTMAEARQYGVDRMVLGPPRQRRRPRRRGRAARPLHRRRRRARPGHRDPRLPRPRRHVRPRHLHRRPRARSACAPADFEELLRREVHPRPPRRRRPGRRDPARHRRADRPRLPRRARSFDWLRLDAALLPEPVPAPTDADLAAEHDAHAADRYTRPETRADHLRQHHPRRPRRRRSRSPRPSSAPPTTPTSTTSRPRSAAPSTASASAPTPRPPPPRPGSTPARPTSTPSPPSAACSPPTSTRASSPPTRSPPEARDAVFGADGPGIVGPVATPARPVALPHQRDPRRQDHALRGGQGRPRRGPRARRGRASRSSTRPRTSRT